MLSKLIPTLFILLILHACSSGNKSEQTIASGTGEFSIVNESYLYDSYYGNFNQKSSRSKDTYIRIEGSINIKPKQKSFENLTEAKRIAQLTIESINDKKFNLNSQVTGMRPRGSVYLNKDSTITYSIQLTQLLIRHSELKELPKDMYIKGYYQYSGDTLRYPYTINAQMSPHHLNIYSRYVNNEIEEELGLTVDPSIVKALIVEHHLYFNSDLPKVLTEFSSVQKLFIREFKTDQPFPEELYTYKQLEELTFHLSFLNSDGDWNDPETDGFAIPEAIFEIPTLKTLRLKSAQKIMFPEIPKGSSLERLEVFLHCTLDSVPQSIVNLSQLKSLRLLGTINSPLPNNLNQLTQLDSLAIYLPDAVIPENFGPWDNLSYALILSSNNSNLNPKEYLRRKEENLPILLDILSNVDNLNIDGIKYGQNN